MIKKLLYRFKIKSLNRLSRLKDDPIMFYNLYKNKKIGYHDVIIDPASKPTVLNLNIIDSCNSKCTMCNIWKRDEELEISPDQLYEILSDDLYSELQYVGVTGGEPTLREDLPEVYRKIIAAVSTLKGVGIITNAIKEKEVIETITKVKAVCDEFNIGFTTMVSIDGVGKVHDQVRGIKENFETAISVYNYIKNDLKIPVAFGCTISKINVWDADELLYYANKHKMYGRFRVAESINRLYNQDRGKVIRNFDDDETYNLLLFFEKLKRTFETNNTYQRTYSSIQNVLQGGVRLIGCPYHNQGIVLGSKGQISYCAPKSKEIGNALEYSSQKIYKDEIGEKKRILKENCNSCIHDYHAPITEKEQFTQKEEKFYKRYLNIDKAAKAVWISRILDKEAKIPGVKRVFIFGWYGTETVGDKAILGGIIDYYKEKYKDKVEFVIGSLFPFITERTCYELEIKAKVVSTKTFDLLKYSRCSDEVVMGGGPLMDLNELYVPLLGFKVAKAFGNKTVIFGCGIGPLKKEKFRKAVIDIFKFSDEVKLRDKKSIIEYKNYGFDKQAEYFGDPAKGFIESLSKSIVAEKENKISCYLRDWTFEYYNGTYEQFLEEKEKLESGIAVLIKNEAAKRNIEIIEFHHMHNFVLGNDDRDFSRYFIEKYFANDSRVFFNKKLSTVHSIVETMKNSNLNICMRFHSVLFAHTLNTDFLAIDYTLGGKIDAFLTDHSCLKNKVSVKQLIEM